MFSLLLGIILASERIEIRIANPTIRYRVLVSHHARFCNSSLLYKWAQQANISNQCWDFKILQIYCRFGKSTIFPLFWHKATLQNSFWGIYDDTSKQKKYISLSFLFISYPNIDYFNEVNKFSRGSKLPYLIQFV